MKLVYRAMCVMRGPTSRDAKATELTFTGGLNCLCRLTALSGLPAHLAGDCAFFMADGLGILVQNSSCVAPDLPTYFRNAPAAALAAAEPRNFQSWLESGLAGVPPIVKDCDIR
jgi:hypothetical protein